ncbi:MAG: diaminopropionate ammonia-lyase [Gammaproteobacteria bacterium]|nr:diaminopropionate ammonia-lyase [Gammaproteobacteria bacterium]
MVLATSSKVLINGKVKSVPRDALHQTFSCNPRLVLDLLTNCPQYEPTPIYDCPNLSSNNSLHQIWVKDETNRMGLGSFKAMGGIYAVIQILQNKIASKLDRRIFPDELFLPEIQNIASKFRFTTASAGNHGISVATGAKLFGAEATIVLSHIVPREFEERLKQIPCSVIWHGENYEQSVEHAIEIAKEPGNILLADSSWEGYTNLPSLVMEGYSVIPEECMNYFLDLDIWPTHIFLQAGVGGFAASFATHVRTYWPHQPTLVIVEPEFAPCLIESIRQRKLTTVEGPISAMGRLDCKRASLIAFNTLMEIADVFLVISDNEARFGKQSLDKSKIETTESGAAGVAGLLSALDYPEIALSIGLDSNSRCLTVITEQK